jgi:hypothetical protein
MAGTRRRRINPQRIGISEAALYHWQRGDKHECHRALGIYPFQWSPFDVDGPEPPKWVLKRRGDTGMSCDSWARAWELRQALCELAGPPGPSDRHGNPLGVVMPPREGHR